MYQTFFHLWLPLKLRPDIHFNVRIDRIGLRAQTRVKARFDRVNFRLSTYTVRKVPTSYTVTVAHIWSLRNGMKIWNVRLVPSLMPKCTCVVVCVMTCMSCYIIAHNACAYVRLVKRNKRTVLISVAFLALCIEA